ncbi:type II 3-dehydroquinate dehydratase [Fusobacterium necrophorum]|uniref:type II 3-dehydroquinate dehydratase n=1 Tax=Fusobacterium necrophorum TaxID=859 RepID=UPI0008814A8C|nr:type II 3-dehydroquinate dehydratase [Fusobacterium necrophorum]AYZ74231.1 type II 3-dehydroquinate dehydratase [Fusobacterium necrophorum]AZW09887.1 type II 3-dehydroquinate dehydratase [Fusobacterium necrophorum subsp. necrophorum]SDB02619.1 3-dehydroquinate dehydratase [Fusobacterium necrophorum]SQD08618.1 3-dehydroquinate dehydratase [Fusobacterium necrophorum subsp. necrophorum]
MKKVLIINGPNINLLGYREPEIYGFETYDNLCNMIQEYAIVLEIDVDIYQSNHEGKIIDKIQDACGHYDAIIINAGAYTHTSIAILDALKAVNIRTVEVHLTNIYRRESYRRKSFISQFAEKTILGKGSDCYIEAMKWIISN